MISSINSSLLQRLSSRLKFPVSHFSLPFSKVQHYGDAALIFATHDGYPQIVNGLLYNHELGMGTWLFRGVDYGETATPLLELEQ